MNTAVIMTLPAKGGPAAYVAAIGALAGELRQRNVRQGRVKKGGNAKGSGRRNNGGRRHDGGRKAHRGRGRRNAQVQPKPKDQDPPRNDDHAAPQGKPNPQGSDAAVAPGPAGMPVPLWQTYHLIGDSMLSKFATFTINVRPIYSKNLGALHNGTCVHGQTISQLTGWIKSPSPPIIGEKNILLIGTNNIVKKVSDPINAMDSLLKLILEQCEVCIVCTIPPIPKLIEDESAVDSLNKLNKWISEIPQEDNLRVCDIASIFVLKKMQ